MDGSQVLCLLYVLLFCCGAWFPCGRTPDGRSNPCTEIMKLSGTGWRSPPRCRCINGTGKSHQKYLMFMLESYGAGIPYTSSVCCRALFQKPCAFFAQHTRLMPTVSYLDVMTIHRATIKYCTYLVRYNCTYQNLSQPMTSYPTRALDTPQESLGTFIPHEDDCYDAGSVQVEACQIHSKSPCRQTHGQQKENQIYGDMQL